MNITPTYKKIPPPSLTEIFDAFGFQLKKEINCAKIGVIQSFDPGSESRAPTATISVAQQQVTSISPEGIKTFAEYPLLLMVPVFFPRGGGFTLTFPIAAGDECLVVFNDREIDGWLSVGPGQAPTIGRIHDLSDGIAFVGLRSNPHGLANISTTATQLRSDNGQTLISVSPAKIEIIADEVVIHGRTKTSIDADGTGLSITPGSINTYADGGSSNPSNPPGPL